MSPSRETLLKYGLSEEEWYEMYNSQGGACHVCGMVPNGRLNVDHAHVKGWKKMPADERKKYVRGLVCFICNNRILTRGVTSEKLRRAADYLDKWSNK